MDATTWTQPTHGDWAPPLDWRDGAFVDELPPLGDGLIAPMGGHLDDRRRSRALGDLARRRLPGARRTRPRAALARARDVRCRRSSATSGTAPSAASDAASGYGYGLTNARRARARQRDHPLRRCARATDRTCAGSRHGARQLDRARQLDLRADDRADGADPRHVDEQGFVPRRRRKPIANHLEASASG